MKLSVCIPTHERHALLEQRCFPSLLQQKRLPDEVIVADSSTGAKTSAFYQEWAQRLKPIPLIYVKTEGRSPARNRWTAFSRSSGDIVLFMDDDIRFTEEATCELLSTFEAHPDVAGIGMRYHFEGAPPQPHFKGRLRNWWLGRSPEALNSISPGGGSIPGKKRVHPNPVPVQWLAGGTMAFRRNALSTVGPLLGVDELFDLRIGVADDTVFSNQASLRGPLMLLTKPLAWHPEKRYAVSTAYSDAGWRRGLRDTIGRAHAHRWLARDQGAVLHDWVLGVTVNFGRAVKDLLREPLAPAAWLRLCAMLYGGVFALLIWRRIPRTPKEPISFSPKWLFL